MLRRATAFTRRRPTATAAASAPQPRRRPGTPPAAPTQADAPWRPQAAAACRRGLATKPPMPPKYDEDSGTTFTYLPSPIYNGVVRKLVELCLDNSCHARREGGDCWRLEEGAEKPSHFPTMTVQFVGGARVKWPPHAYLFQRGEPTLWCEAFADNGVNSDTVLGVSWMLHKDIIFDLHESKLGIAEARCPEYRKIPGEADRGFEVAMGKTDRSWVLTALLILTTISGVLFVAAALMWLIAGNYCGECCSTCRQYVSQADTEESLVGSVEGSPKSVQTTASTATC